MNKHDSPRLDIDKNNVITIVKLARERGFKTHVMTTIWAANHLVHHGDCALVNDTCLYLLLEEIRMWLRNSKHGCVLDVYVGLFDNSGKTCSTSDVFMCKKPISGVRVNNLTISSERLSYEKCIELSLLRLLTNHQDVFDK